MISPTDGHNFDDIAAKFQKNIYGTTKGQLRHELLLHYLKNHTPLHQPGLDILDAGGGTGMMSGSLLQLGHRVELNDISAESVQMAKLRLQAFPQFSCKVSSILELDQSKKYDLILCHAVLEWLAEPLPVINKLCTLLKPQGYLSLSFFNRHAHVLGNMIYGNFDYVEAGLPRKNTVRLNPQQPHEPKMILQHFNSLPMTIIHQAGLRCFHDYLKDKNQQVSHYQQLKNLELQYGGQEPFLWLGKYFHIIAKAE